MTEIYILGACAAALLLCVIAKFSILYALGFGYFLFFAYGLWKKQSVLQMLKLSLRGILTVKNILVTFVLIGVITAVWRVGGTIPFIVYYATKAFSPAGMVLITFLLCCLLSVLTGTALGTAATVGIICMTVANSMGIPPWYAGGAILAGIYFGDRCSPLSTSALLVAELTGTKIFDNLSNMVKTSVVPFFVTCLLYLFMGVFCKTGAGTVNIQAAFANYFDLNPIVLVPAGMIVVLSLCRLNVKITMGSSILAAAVITLRVQHVMPAELLRVAIWGYHPENAELAALLSGGGVLSMAKVFAIVCLSACYAGMFNGTGFLDGIKANIDSLSKKATSFGAVLLTAFVTGLIACNQTLAIMLTHQLCKDVEKNKEALALYLEDSAVVVAPLIPWSVACAVPLASVGAPSSSVLLAFYLYLLPLWGLFCAMHPKARFPGCLAKQSGRCK
ncbi:MAG: Na+/H+ antiporter NhaC family protein [Candidatus Pelethousia sp.]|nr:Na+/H+ antiporter NhaC family protein [Candidatus Pelethousia sp.]